MSDDQSQVQNQTADGGNPPSVADAQPPVADANPEGVNPPAGDAPPAGAQSADAPNATRELTKDERKAAERAAKEADKAAKAEAKAADKAAKQAAKQAEAEVKAAAKAAKEQAEAEARAQAQADAERQRQAHGGVPIAGYTVIRAFEYNGVKFVAGDCFAPHEVGCSVRHLQTLLMRRKISHELTIGVKGSIGQGIVSTTNPKRLTEIARHHGEGVAKRVAANG